MLPSCLLFLLIARPMHDRPEVNLIKYPILQNNVSVQDRHRHIYTYNIEIKCDKTYILFYFGIKI